MDYSKNGSLHKCTSHICEVSHDVCYEGSIGNNLIVNVYTDKGKVVYESVRV